MSSSKDQCKLKVENNYFSDTSISGFEKLQKKNIPSGLSYSVLGHLFSMEGFLGFGLLESPSNGGF